MSKHRNWLGIMLAVQLVLAVGLYWGDLRTLEGRLAKSLLEFDAQSVNRVTISGDEKDSALEKIDSHWVVSSLDNLPAAAEKLAGLIDSLEDLQAGWPVATTSSSLQRFEVAEDKFQRHLKLFKDDELLAELYTGTSPGFRKIHARRPGDDEIYAVKLNNYDMPVDHNQWLDKSLLSAGDLTSVKAGNFSLINRDGAWQLQQQAGSPETARLDEGKSGKLVSALTSLQVQSLAPDISFPEPSDASLRTLEVVGSARWQYEVFEQDEKHYVRRSDIDHVFVISPVSYEHLTLNPVQLPVEDQPVDDLANEGESG